MSKTENTLSAAGRPLAQAVRLSPDKILNPGEPVLRGPHHAGPLLVVLAAGKGTRFGNEPKCIQPVCGTPLARHSIDGIRRMFSQSPVICIVGYRHAEVASALGSDNLYIRS